MAAEASQVIYPWDFDSAKPCRGLRHASVEALEILGFVYDPTVGRWLIPPPRN
jgi:hypothetical protein